MKQKTYLSFGLILMLSSCFTEETYVPKPIGHIRFDLPEKNYIDAEVPAPIDFPIPEYGIIRKAHGYAANNQVFNLEFPQYKATVHCTYRPIEDNLRPLIQSSRELALEHQVKATRITEKVFSNDENRTYGLLYKIEGNVASNVQFYLTDSTNHFLRGALYFAVRPNADSLAPAVDYITEDILHLLEESEWQSNDQP